MKARTMTSFERVTTALNQREPDQVPLFLFLSLYGAKEMGMSVQKYFSQPDHVVTAQLKMKAKYRHDCLYAFFYAAIEIEAMGGEVVYTDCGPPNTGQPVIKSSSKIKTLDLPRVRTNRCLIRVLEVIQQLKAKVGTGDPIIGVVMSPFSLAALQLGLGKYLELLYFDRHSFRTLMQKNSVFCIEWANAQLEAGADAICYFNPLASPDLIERKTYLNTGYPIDKLTLSQINGPTAMHLASGMTLPVVKDIIDTGAAVLGFSSQDDLDQIKQETYPNICLLGNLNGLEMVHWNTDQARQQVRLIIDKVGPGGSLILADNHGEIPWQVPEKILLAISEAVQHYGRYPLDGNKK
ncbi:MAG: methylcobamide--CoM methyltransferase MtbA [Firmicutes bacterium]|nr:methylcobamide--CoM methyltransferase MtbA [Bacillota bacterium]